MKLPATLAKNFEISYQDSNGKWHLLEKVENNFRRLLVWDNLELEVKAVRFKLRRTWGNKKINIFSWDIA